MGLYKQLNLEERKNIYQLQKSGKGCVEIAGLLCRNKSTVSRELRRNNSAEIGYLPDTADVLSRQRKRRNPKIFRSEALQDYVMKGLHSSWAPEAISGRMRREKQSFYACAETIYCYIYAQKDLYKLLTKSKPKRTLRGSKRCHSRIVDAISIHDRPSVIEKRKEIGHWEGDLVMFGGQEKSGNIATLVERKSRYSIAIKNTDKRSETVMSGIRNRLATLPKAIRKSITFDRGGEFSNHFLLKNSVGIDSYFCDPHSPWQKGSNENFNGRLRRFVPRGTTPENISEEKLENILKIMNNTPRKCLKFQTPNEAFSKDLKRCCTWG